MEILRDWVELLTLCYNTATEIEFILLGNHPLGGERHRCTIEKWI